MMYYEFVELTGFAPTENYYFTRIEPEYNSSHEDKKVWHRTMFIKW